MINIKQFLLSFLICAGLEPCIFARTKIPVQKEPDILLSGPSTPPCDTEIEKFVKECTSVVKQGSTETKEIVRSGKRQSDRNKITMDIEGYAFDLWGVNIMNIPGMSAPTVLRLVAELGENFTDKFADAKQFVCWANLVPNNKISGGKLLSSKVQKKKNPVGLIFRQCANSLYKSNEPLGDYFRHIKSRSGHIQAMVATGKKLATSSLQSYRQKTNMIQLCTPIIGKRNWIAKYTTSGTDFSVWRWSRQSASNCLGFERTKPGTESCYIEALAGSTPFISPSLDTPICIHPPL